MNERTGETCEVPDLECEKAMNAMFSKIMESAVNDGWSKAKAAYYIAEAADHFILSLWQTSKKPN
jgi:hypothetical protein